MPELKGQICFWVFLVKKALVRFTLRLRHLLRLTDMDKTTGHFLVSDEKNKLDVNLIHKYLSAESYWAKNIPLVVIKASVDNSLCFGVYDTSENVQAGFA